MQYNLLNPNSKAKSCLAGDNPSISMQPKQPQWNYFVKEIVKQNMLAAIAKLIDLNAVFHHSVGYSWIKVYF